ncbi:unnamed protein product [Caenorhabditis bovis]|uniref:VWFA domain-containing protein n=1 Tax=Caenorhabditis bovis TaxID=2654633 RepID=A0A8S1EW67_9PELO|nr:unnamed protein product [Caenorhabditis bovis]
MLLVSANSMAAIGVELSFGVRNVRFYNGFDGVRARIHSLDANDGDIIEQIGQTEVIYNNQNVQFSEKCSINFRFEKIQRLKVTINSMNSSTNSAMGVYGDVQFDLAILMSNGGSIALPIPNTRSMLDIFANVSEYYSQHLELKFSGSYLHSPNNLPLAFYYILSLPAGNRNIMLHKSEIIKDEKYPIWSSFRIPLFILNFYNESPIQIHVYNIVGNHPDELVGHCATTLTQLQRGVGAFNSYMLKHSSGARVHEKTYVELKEIQLVPGPSFFEMLKNKTNLHVTEAIDLTASNGNPVQENSLHYIHPHRPSPYLKAILQVTPPLLAYMPNPSNPEIGALGFGANVSTGTSLQLSHCFFLNGSHTDHRVSGLVGLIDAYRNSSMSVQPFAPTDFSEVIYFVSKFAKAETIRKVGLYFVLVIFSDGGPAVKLAMRRTIDAVVDASFHPMSIIAIGVGNDRDFTPMRNLENMAMKHSDGRPLARQNYTFVEATDLEESDVLSMIPLQMIQWKQKFAS